EARMPWRGWSAPERSRSSKMSDGLDLKPHRRRRAPADRHGIRVPPRFATPRGVSADGFDMEGNLTEALGNARQQSERGTKWRQSSSTTLKDSTPRSTIPARRTPPCAYGRGFINLRPLPPTGSLGRTAVPPLFRPAFP